MRVVAGMLAVWSVLVGAPAPARAAEVHVHSSVSGDAYQLVTADGELLSRRRPHVSLGLGVHDLLCDEKNGLSVVTLMRFDSDMGAADDERERIYGEPSPHRLVLQVAYAEGRDLFGLLDFKAGRLLHSDPIDFMMLDGVVATVRTPWHVGLEVLAGLEAREGTSAITFNPQELDGVRAIEGPAGEPPPPDAARVALGAALVTTGLTWTSARIGYRRMFSDGAIHQEKVGVGLYQRIAGRVHASFDGSYDLFAADVDQVRALVRAEVTDAFDLEAQYVRLLPVFDTDSIFNIFAARALNDANLRARLHFSRDERAYIGGMVRLFGADPHGTAGVDGVVEAWGVMAGWSRRFGARGRLAANLSFEDGYGGQRGLVDIGGSWTAVRHVLELDGRLTCVGFAEDLRPELRAISAGYQLGGRWRAGEHIWVELGVEHNFSRLQTSQLRVFAMVDLDVWR